jgi:hypothetical protein
MRSAVRQPGPWRAEERAQKRKEQKKEQKKA